MRYKPELREKTRQRMLEAVKRTFRSLGYAGIGVDGIAKAIKATDSVAG